MQYGNPGGREEERSRMLIFKEIMAKNLPNLGRDLAVQVHEANRSPKISNQESSSPRHYKKTV